MFTFFAVTKLFGKFDYKIDFTSTDPITIITGPNGYGKTTILKIIDLFFTQDIRELLSLQFETISFSSSSNETTIIKRIDKSKFEIDGILFNLDNKKHIDNFQLEFFVEKFFLDKEIGNNILKAKEHINSFSFNNLKNYCNTKDSKKLKLIIRNINQIIEDTGTIKFIREQRLIKKEKTKTTDNEYKISIIESSKQLKETISNILEKHSALSSSLDSSYVKRLFSYEHNENIDNNPQYIREKLNELSEQQSKLKKYGLMDSDTLTTNLDDRKINKFNIELQIYIKDTTEKLAIFKDLLKKLDLYEHIVNKKLSFKHISLSHKGGIEVINDQGLSIPLESLSSGEQEILVLFYELIFSENINLLMIDEPEISLHIAWQKELIKDLYSIANINNGLQIIIATHSPQIVSYNWNSQVDLGALYNELN